MKCTDSSPHTQTLAHHVLALPQQHSPSVSQGPQEDSGAEYQAVGPYINSLPRPRIQPQDVTNLAREISANFPEPIWRDAVKEEQYFYGTGRMEMSQLDTYAETGQFGGYEHCLAVDYWHRIYGSLPCQCRDCTYGWREHAIACHSSRPVYCGHLGVDWSEEAGGRSDAVDSESGSQASSEATGRTGSGARCRLNPEAAEFVPGS